ncbi:phage major capsid protein [Stappia sp. F7233]|uniref:Phage major capsid protein n=1 Tax=Stappia albiluteola TaxID=2758565 RepID=A0A839AM33_9HYPH|nr:phage major capsid protein [Stappia albiluteola]MBA5779489.1 phage major capsid protein [Stappia albiluteola]
MDDELKSLIKKQGEAFDAFKETHEELRKADALTEEKLSRIEKALDDAVEAKAKLEARFDAEKKEREDLELRLSRKGIRANGDAEANQEVQLKEFNATLQGLAADRKRSFQPLDHGGMSAYKAALEQWVRHGEREMSPEEVKTLQISSDAEGGYFVTPDTAGRMVTQIYESSPIRQIASQQTISTDALEGIEDLGEAGAGYAGERKTSANTDTPDVGKWRIPVHWIDTEPKATQQLLDDSSINIEAWLSGKVADKFARFENAEFVTGATKIRGFCSYEVAADDGTGVEWGKIGYVPSGAVGDFAADDPADAIFDLVGLLKNEYLNNARFVTRRTVITKIRKFKDGQGNYLWQPSFVAGQPETIVGHPVTRAEDMPGLGANSLSLAFGDFARAYQIVDRQGVRVLRDALTSKPYVKFYTTKRVGGGVLNFEALKFMRFAAA